MTTHDQQTRSAASSSADGRQRPGTDRAKGWNLRPRRTEPSADTSPTESEPLTAVTVVGGSDGTATHGDRAFQ